MGNYHKMLKRYKEKGLFSEAKMWESIESLDELLEEMEEKDPEMFWDFMREQHCIFCGPHFDERFGKWQVEQMHSKGPDGKEYKGELCNIMKSEEVFDKYKAKLPAGTTIWDMYVAVNSNMHDKCALFKKWNPEKWEDMVIEDAIVFYFEDVDWESPGKVWDYMNADD